MKILYQMPSLYSVNAGRTIYFGYKHAFEDLGHTFRPLTSDDDPQTTIKKYKPDIIFTSLNQFCLKYLPADIVKESKKKGAKVFVNIAPWHSPMSKLRISEVPSISDNNEYIRLISSREYGDVYYNIYEQGDEKMDGFAKTTGYKHETILLAADKTIAKPEFSQEFASDISFIGTFLPEKRAFMRERLFPLKEMYNVKIYGRDWTMTDRWLNFIHRVGQYYNLPYLRTIKKYKPTLEEERSIHRSSLIALNIHEDYQKRGKGDLNERTFKIPHSFGFEIVDDVPSLPKYFVPGKEMTIAKNKNEWFDKINYYIKHPEKRLPIIQAGRKRVLKDHTYHNRVAQIIKIYKSLR